MYAVHAVTGTQRWQFQREDGILVLPIVVGDLSVFGDIAGWLYGVDKSNGTDAGDRTEPV